ncbi:MAG: F0F1 ATP synthase subunit delta [Porticoccaceae bacterium]
MAEQITLARPYARAAFEYADAAGSLEDWSKALQQLVQVVANEKVATALSDPLATTDQRARILIDLMGDELDSGMQNFVHNMADNKRVDLFGEISQLFDLMKANREQVLDVKLKTAFDLDDVQRDKLAGALSKHLNRKVALEVETDNSLIGGALIHAGDTLIDGSVKGRLGKLKDAIAH